MLLSFGLSPIFQPWSLARATSLPNRGMLQRRSHQQPSRGMKRVTRKEQNRACRIPRRWQQQ